MYTFLENFSTMYCSGYRPDSYCTCRLLYTSSFSGWDGSPGTLSLVFHTVHILLKNILLCIAQATFLTATAPADFSTPPPSLDGMDLQVNYLWWCVLYTFCWIIFHHVLLRLPPSQLLHLLTTPLLLLLLMRRVSRYTKIGVAYYTHFVEYYFIMNCSGYLAHSCCTCRPPAPPGTLELALRPIHILWNTIPLCIAQATSLTAAAPEDCSPTPPSLDGKWLEVSNLLCTVNA